MPIPHNIREWREFNGLKQDALAALAGLSQGTVGRIERGTRNYTQASLEALAHAMKTRPAYLLEFDPNEDPKFWRAWLKLSERERRRAIRKLREFAKAEILPSATRH